MITLKDLETSWMSIEEASLQTPKKSLLKNLYEAPSKWWVPAEFTTWKLRPPTLENGDVVRVLEGAISGLNTIEQNRSDQVVRVVYGKEAGITAKKFRDRLMPPLLYTRIGDDQSVLLSAVRFQLMQVSTGLIALFVGFALAWIALNWSRLTYPSSHGVFWLDVWEKVEIVGLPTLILYLIINGRLLSVRRGDPAYYESIKVHARHIRDALVQAGWTDVTDETAAALAEQNKIP